jgi:hypothetical protein
MRYLLITLNFIVEWLIFATIIAQLNVILVIFLNNMPYKTKATSNGFYSSKTFVSPVLLYIYI